jgi:3-oxoacyl-ACP reductase-like protein
VSTLSTDSFKTVTPHLFPTIAGNMAGTATLDGASWDLKGMSNYSAQCQVYATQSGANTQSVTSAASDSVALAAAAEAAAKVQMAKDMISNWALTNEELAKKYRDNRLAGKP